MKTKEMVQRIRHMLKVKDCRHVCLFCKYFEKCRNEVENNEHEIRNEK